MTSNLNPSRMKNLLICFTIIFCFIGCKTKTVFVPVKEIHIEKEIVRDTIISVKLEKEYIKQTTPNRYSFLENKYAKSTASFDSISGLLSHDLNTKDEEIPFKIKYIEKTTTDSIQTPYPVYVDRPVDKPVRMLLRWWEAIFMYIGMVAVGGSACWIVMRFKK